MPCFSISSRRSPSGTDHRQLRLAAAPTGAAEQLDLTTSAHRPVLPSADRHRSRHPSGLAAPRLSEIQRSRLDPPHTRRPDVTAGTDSGRLAIRRLRVRTYLRTTRSKTPR